MDDLFKQIRGGLVNNLYYLSLYVTLAIPDICGALESDDGIATGAKYKNWFNENLLDKYGSCFTGADCYYFRCSLLHQGTSQHNKNSYERILFIEPSITNIVMHRCVIDNALNIDLRIFCEDIISAAEQWVEKVKYTDNYISNSKKSMQRYENGLKPYIVGIPIIS